jgi:hypothetical protein
MDEKELPKKMLWTNPGAQRGCANQNQDELTG